MLYCWFLGIHRQLRSSPLLHCSIHLSVLVAELKLIRPCLALLEVDTAILELVRRCCLGYWDPL